MKKLKIINLFGAAGIGKSSVRSGVYWLMNSLGYSIQEVDEYAKYLELTNQRDILRNQQSIVLAHQHNKQVILKGKYEFAVTDSPLHLCGYYASRGYVGLQENPPMPHFNEVIMHSYQEFENINFYLTRDLSKNFQEAGRSQKVEDSLRDQALIKEYLLSQGLSFFEIEVSLLSPFQIYNKICEVENMLPKLDAISAFDLPCGESLVKKSEGWVCKNKLFSSPDEYFHGL